MPDGATPPFAWTLQPADAIFDPPVEITYPNMYALPAGSIAYFRSFGHATNRFEIVVTGHVTNYGFSIISDPGAGIVKAGWGCNCPQYAIIGQCRKDSELCEGVEFVKVEFDTAKVNVRNLNSGAITKSVAVIADSSQTIDVADFLTEDSDIDRIKWLKNDDPKHPPSSVINYGLVKDLGEIKWFTIKAASICTSDFDELIVVIVPKKTKDKFDAWYSNELGDKSWLNELPDVYRSLGENNEDPEPEACTNWGVCPLSIFDTVCGVGNYFHPGAAFEMRSVESPGGHGHQATYASNGNLLRTGIKAGSADKGFATLSNAFQEHVRHDVNSYIWAAQLDGNNVEGNAILSNFTRPLMYEGAYFQKYLEVRPAFTSADPTLLEPDKCPGEL